MKFSELDLFILKTLITNKKYSLDFVHDFDAKLFSPDVWNAANTIINYIRTYKELPTLRVILERLSKSNNERLAEHVKEVWQQLDGISYDDKEYKHDLEKLKKRYAEKQIIQIRECLVKQDSAIDVSKSIVDMQKTIQLVKNLNQTKVYDRKTLKDSIHIFREEYNAKLENENFDRGVLTGYSYLDYVTDGLRPAELLLIGGESGSGKSMLLMNMAIQLWMQSNTVDMESNFLQGEDILYYSLEMPFKPCLNRVLSRLANVPSKLIRSAKLNAAQLISLKRALKFISRYPHQFEIIDMPRNVTIEAIEQVYEDSKSHFNPRIIVIDYLGLMEYEDPNMDDWLKLGKIAEKCHELARVHNCIVLSAVQLNRSKGKEMEDKIGLHRIGRSSMILQNANIAIQIHTRPKENLYPDMEYFIIKNRDGELGMGKMIKNLSCGSLLDEPINPEELDAMKDYDANDISDKISDL